MSSVVNIFDGALAANPPGGARHLSPGGSDWLFTITAIMFVSFLVVALMAIQPFNNERIFHYIFIITLLSGTVGYYAMASDLAWVVRKDYQIFWAKYIVWAIFFGAINLALGLMSGIPWTSIVYAIFLSWVWVISYLFSALTSSRYKWGFFTFGTVALLLLAFHTLFHGVRSSRRLEIGRHYTVVAVWTNLIWLLYPISFGVGDGGKVLSVTRSFIFSGILDLLLMPLLAFVFLILARKWDHSRMNLHFTQYGRVPASGPVHLEKGPVAPNSQGPVPTTGPAAPGGGVVAPGGTTGHDGTTGAVL